MGKPFVNRVGEHYGRLTVIRYVGVSSKAGKYRLWECQCECGNSVTVSYRELARGHTKSCGCWFKEVLRASGGKNKKEVGISAFNQLYLSYKRSAEKRNYTFDLTEDEFRKLVELPCFYCGNSRLTKAPSVKKTNGDYYYTGIDRIDNARGYTLDNVRPCCKQCNIAKGVLSEQDFLDWIRRVCATLEGKTR